MKKHIKIKNRWDQKKVKDAKTARVSVEAEYPVTGRQDATVFVEKVEVSAHFMDTIRGLEDKARGKAMTRKEVTDEVRNRYTELVDELESKGFCTDRECMCDEAECVVKLGAAITALEGMDEALDEEKGTQGETASVAAKS